MLILLSAIGYFIYSNSNLVKSLDDITDSPDQKEISAYPNDSNSDADSLLNDNMENESNSLNPKNELNNHEIKVTNQFEREKIEKKKTKQLEKENLEKKNKRIKINETNIYINNYELKISNTNQKYNRSYYMNLLKRDLNKLKSFLNDEKYKQIDGQIQKVDNSFIKLEMYIKGKELDNAKDDANKLIISLKDTPYKNKLKEEILNLRSTLKKNDTKKIRLKMNSLRKKEALLKETLIKQKDSISTTKFNSDEPQKNK